MRLYLLAKAFAFGLTALAILASAVWFSARELKHGGACSVTSLDALLGLSASELQRVDIARMNLLCGQGLPGTDCVNLKADLAKLDNNLNI
jgi:hypothetical protein